jgi:hypothetical protein
MQQKPKNKAVWNPRTLKPICGNDRFEVKWTGDARGHRRPQRDVTEGWRRRRAVSQTIKHLCRQLATCARKGRRFSALLACLGSERCDPRDAAWFRRRLLQGDCGWLPPIRIRSNNAMAGRREAFELATGSIYLNRDILNQQAALKAACARGIAAFIAADLGLPEPSVARCTLFARVLIEVRSPLARLLATVGRWFSRPGCNRQTMELPPPTLVTLTTR